MSYEKSYSEKYSDGMWFVFLGIPTFILSVVLTAGLALPFWIIYWILKAVDRSKAKQEEEQERLALVASMQQSEEAKKKMYLASFPPPRQSNIVYSPGPDDPVAR